MGSNCRCRLIFCRYSPVRVLLCLSFFCMTLHLCLRLRHSVLRAPFPSLPFPSLSCPRSGSGVPPACREICLSLGVDSPSEVLFLTDLIAEAEAAKLADVRTVLSVRPGNDPLPAVSVLWCGWCIHAPRREGGSLRFCYFARLALLASASCVVVVVVVVVVGRRWCRLSLSLLLRPS